MSDDLREIEAENTQAETVDGDVFELVYDGPDVANGTMSARQVVEVVSGLHKAFSIVAHDKDFGDRYELRIRDIDHASIHLVFEAIAYVKANPATSAVLVSAASVGVSGLTNAVSGAYRVVTDIAASIQAKKKAKGERLSMMPASFTDGEVTIQTPDGPLTLTKEQYELLLSQRIDKPLAQIVSPLAPAKVTSFQVRRQNQDLVSVDAGQRDYFDYFEVTEEKSKEGTEIVGSLNSLTKSSLRGTFYTSEGVHVPYKYVGGDMQQLLRGFASKEQLRVVGKIKFGNDGYPTFICSARSFVPRDC